eukprot:gene12542-15760_t
MLRILGERVEGSELVAAGSVHRDENSMGQQRSLYKFRWHRKEAASGTWSCIQGAKQPRYELTRHDVGALIKVALFEGENRDPSLEAVAGPVQAGTSRLKQNSDKKPTHADEARDPHLAPDGQTSTTEKMSGLSEGIGPEPTYQEQVASLETAEDYAVQMADAGREQMQHLFIRLRGLYSDTPSLCGVQQVQSKNSRDIGDDHVQPLRDQHVVFPNNEACNKTELPIQDEQEGLMANYCRTSVQHTAPNDYPFAATVSKPLMADLLAHAEGTPFTVNRSAYSSACPGLASQSNTRGSTMASNHLSSNSVAKHHGVSATPRLDADTNHLEIAGLCSEVKELLNKLSQTNRSSSEQFCRSSSFTTQVHGDDQCESRHESAEPNCFSGHTREVPVPKSPLLALQHGYAELAQPCLREAQKVVSFEPGMQAVAPTGDVLPEINPKDPKFDNKQTDPWFGMVPFENRSTPTRQRDRTDNSLLHRVEQRSQHQMCMTQELVKMRDEKAALEEQLRQTEVKALVLEESLASAMLQLESMQTGERQVCQGPTFPTHESPGTSTVNCGVPCGGQKERFRPPSELKEFVCKPKPSSVQHPMSESQLDAAAEVAELKKQIESWQYNAWRYAIAWKAERRLVRSLLKKRKK